MGKFIFNLNAILLMVPAIYTGFFPGKIIVITALCLYPILLMLWSDYFRVRNRELSSPIVIKFYLVVNVAIFVRALIDISSAQDLSVTFGSMVFTTLMFPLYIFYVKKENFIPICRSIAYFAIPLSFISYFFPSSGGFMSFQHNISIVYLFIFFIPFVSRKWRILFLALAVIGITYDFTRRSFSLNLIMSILILIGYSIFSKSIFMSMSKYAFYILVISPIVFLVLGLTGIFNIFKIGEGYEDFVLKNQSSSRNILVDSRTSIYNDVFSGLKEKNSFFFGLGGNGKVKTSLADLVKANFDVIYKDGRRNTESGMLNYIQWGGLVAAFSYWLLLTTASYKAIYKSRNGLIQMVGLFVGFKVVYSFIEDTISVQIGSFYLMFMIGLCYNKYIRNLRNDQIKFLIQNVFK